MHRDLAAQEEGVAAATADGCRQHYLLLVHFESGTAKCLGGVNVHDIATRAGDKRPAGGVRVQSGAPAGRFGAAGEEELDGGGAPGHGPEHAGSGLQQLALAAHLFGALALRHAASQVSSEKRVFKSMECALSVGGIRVSFSACLCLSLLKVGTIIFVYF